MIEQIFENYRASTYDFRAYANPDDPLRHLFDEWVDYYRLKWAISRTLQPRKILEIGVRFGYSSRAFLDASPHASLLGIDADRPDFGGHLGAVDWAHASITGDGFDFTVLKQDTQALSAFPGGIYDLIHVDGQQDGDGTFRDLDLAVTQARYILVDGYQWTRDNYLAVNEWLWLNKAAIHSALVIPGYAGEMLIRTKVSLREQKSGEVTSDALVQTYTKDYYLNDCGGFSEWRRSKGGELDPRLQAVANAAQGLQQARRVVDLGAGRGELTRYFAKAGAQVTAIDYSSDACELISQTLEDDAPLKERVRVVCGSVLDESSYAGDYDLALASDVVEHLSPEENEKLYALVSDKLEASAGLFVVHTAPNLWCYRYQHPRDQREAKRIGMWLPKARRTWYEKLMHINEQSPRVLKRQLQRHFPHVHVWFSGESMAGSLVQRFRIADFRKAGSIFAIASHTPIDFSALVGAFSMQALDGADRLETTFVSGPEAVSPGERFTVRVRLRNTSAQRVASLPPHPVNLSYHWLGEDGEEVVFDGLRSPLRSSLEAHGEEEREVLVEAPRVPGRYLLQPAAVQEGVRWHEPVQQLITVTVKG